MKCIQPVILISNAFRISNLVEVWNRNQTNIPAATTIHLDYYECVSTKFSLAKTGNFSLKPLNYYKNRHKAHYGTVRLVLCCAALPCSSEEGKNKKQKKSKYKLNLTHFQYIFPQIKLLNAEEKNKEIVCNFMQFAEF